MADHGHMSTHRLVDVEPGGHPPQNSGVQILRTIGGSHDDHLTYAHGDVIITVVSSRHCP